MASSQKVNVSRKSAVGVRRSRLREEVLRLAPPPPSPPLVRASLTLTYEQTGHILKFGPATLCEQ